MVLVAQTPTPPPIAATGAATAVVAPPPGFTIREATPADAEAVCDVFFDAFRDDEIARRVFPAGSRRARAEMLRSFADDLANPECHNFVAVDPASGGIVASATWSPPGAAWERYPAGGAEEHRKGGREEEEKDDEEGDGELGAEFFAMMDRKHGEHMGRRPHWTLGFLAVRRAWQGRGVTRPLVAWGLGRADAAALPAYVQASPRAVPVYRRYGFEPIDAYAFRRIDYSEVFMLRPPRPHGTTEAGVAS